MVLHTSNPKMYSKVINIVNDGGDILETEKKYFDFGISTEQGGRYLNEGLVFQKEGFGARAVVYDTYAIKL